MINLLSVGRFFLPRGESNEGEIICQLQELEGLVSGGAAIGAQGDNRGKRRQPRGEQAFGLLFYFCFYLECFVVVPGNQVLYWE